MDFFDLMSISHRYMEILNPSTSEKIIKLGNIWFQFFANSIVFCISPL